MGHDHNDDQDKGVSEIQRTKPKQCTAKAKSAILTVSRVASSSK